MLRICLWILIGATTACFWALVMTVIGPRYNVAHWPILTITVPASLFGRNRPVTYYESMLINAALYGLIGLALEPVFRFRHKLLTKNSSFPAR
jgi:hypothetical protein